LFVFPYLQTISQGTFKILTTFKQAQTYKTQPRPVYFNGARLGVYLGLLLIFLSGFSL